jgi:putative nucleotidyltransferase with HDIG domain
MIRELNDNEIRALHYELLLKDILAMAERLPPFPDIVWKVVPLIRKMAPAKEIERIIKYDQTITARIIALCQSAYYARRHAVSSLQDAIVILGDQRLVQVIMMACAARYFHGRASKYDPSERELWQHSVETALMAEMIARHISHQKILTVYTASLLHDIGKTVLDLYAKIYLGSSLSQVREPGVQFIEAERRAYGIDHQELGEIITRRWRFPQEVVVAIGHHHCPEKARTDRTIAEIVYAADRIVTDLKRDDRTTEPFEPEKDAIFLKLGVTSHHADDFGAKLAEAMEGIVQFLTAPV